MRPARPTREPDEARAAFAHLVVDQGETFAALSRMIGRGDGYLQRYARDGVPQILPPAARRLLSRYLGVDEWTLGGEDPGQIIRPRRPPPD